MLNKKIKGLLAVCILVFGVTGCSKEVPQGTVDAKNETAVKESTNETEQVTREDGMEKTPLFTNKDLNLEGDIEGVKYNFKAVQVSKLKLYTEEAASMFEVNKDDELTAVVFEVDAENTLDKDISFYISQAKLITNTKEQVDPDMMLSEYIEGDFLGAVKKEGTLVYLLKNTTPEELKTLELRIDAPMDSETFDNIGEDVKLNLEINM